MCVVRFISDLHFGHKGMAQSYRKFQDEYYQDEYIISQWNKVVKKQDLTYILGDITMEKKDHYYQLDRLNGKKKVVLGNHDMIQHVPELLKYVDGVAGMIEYKGFILTHCPVHKQELYEKYRGNIHGHLHNNFVLMDPMLADYLGQKDPKYINVCCDVIDYTPRTIEELIKERL